MTRKLGPLVAACLIAGLSAAEPETVRVSVVQTTDIHGRVMPWDYYSEKPADVGLARAAAFVKQVRADNPNVILLDDGDTIQGTPLTYYFERVDPLPKNPLMAVLNAMKYDAMTVGNHEYNYGMKVLEKCRAEARFPFLSANTYKKGGKDPYFAPYIVKEFGGVRVGVLGLTTPNVPNWETPANYDGLQFRDTLSEAKKWVAVLREKERVDAVVINTHEGFEVDLDKAQPGGTSRENRAYAVATEVPGVDVVLTGHAHENIPPRLLGGVLVSQARRFCEQVTRLDLVFRKEGSRWVLAEKSGVNVAMDGKFEPDPDIVSLVKTYHETVLGWINSVVGEASEEFAARGVFTEDTALMDFMHQVVLKKTGAQMSMLSYLPGGYVPIKKGPVRVKDLFALYPFENTAVTLALKGKDIREVLERSAEIYDRVEWDAAKPSLKVFQTPEFRRYAFNTLAGASYAIDPTAPKGSRVAYLEVGGKPVADDEEYTVVTTNYQAAGAGGRYPSFKSGRTVGAESTEIRDLLMEAVKAVKTISPACDRNWHLRVPAEFVFPERRQPTR